MNTPTRGNQILQEMKNLETKLKETFQWNPPGRAGPFIYLPADGRKYNIQSRAAYMAVYTFSIRANACGRR